MKYCGECPDFTNEDVDGNGYCEKIDKNKNCADECQIKENECKLYFICENKSCAYGTHYKGGGVK